MREPSRQTTATLIAGGDWAGSDGARQVGDHQTFGAVGDAGKRERPARRLSRRAGAPRRGAALQLRFGSVGFRRLCV